MRPKLPPTQILAATLLLIVSLSTQAAISTDATQIVVSTSHSFQISSLEFLPTSDRPRVVSMSSTGDDSDSIKIWEFETGKLIRTIPNTSDYNVSSLSVDSQGRKLLAYNRLYDLQSGMLVKTYEDKSDDQPYLDEWLCTASSLSPDETKVGVTRTESADIYDLQSAVLLKRISSPEHRYNSIAFSSDMVHALIGGEVKNKKRGFIEIWDLKKGISTGQLSVESEVTTAIYSDDGKNIAFASRNGMISVIYADNLNTIGKFYWPKEIKSLNKQIDIEFAAVKLRFLKDRGQLLASIDGYVVGWHIDTSTRAILMSLNANGRCDPISHDGKFALSRGSPVTENGTGYGPLGISFRRDDPETTFTIWDLVSGKPTRQVGTAAAQVAIATSPDGSSLLTSAANGDIQRWNLRDGEQDRWLHAHDGPISLVDFSPDGKYFVTAGEDDKIKLWDATKFEQVSLSDTGNYGLSSAAFSDDGKFLVTGGYNNTVRIWNIPDLKLLRVLGRPNSGLNENSGDGYFDHVTAVSFGISDRVVMSGHSDGILKIWRADSGKILNKLQSEFGDGGAVNFRSINSILATATGQIVVANDSGVITIWESAAGGKVRFQKVGKVRALKWLPDLQSFVSAGASAINRHALSGKITQRIPVEQQTRPPANVTELNVVHGGSVAIGAVDDGTIGLWDLGSGRLILTLIHTGQAGWLSVAPEGFFDASNFGGDASGLISIVRGLKLFDLQQFFEHLYRPDLIEQVLRGDPDGIYADAASKLNLQTILDSGDTPELSVLADKTEKAGDTIKATVRIVSTGGGIGPKVVWRVNGQTMGDNVTPAPTPEGFVLMTNVLRVNPGKQNIVEVTAYNGDGLLASPPLRFVVDAFGVTSTGGSRLFILSIGIREYAMKDYNLLFPELDADAIADSLSEAGRGLFVNTIPVVVKGSQATKKGIEDAFERLSKDVKPSDVFILFLSGHGESRVGRYYYIPQDFDSAKGDVWDTKWIGQDQWERWLSSIVAEKQVLILDTCEGGAALGLVKGRSERETAMDQLRYATGRSIIAAAEGPARESKQLGHGVLTYSILQSLKAGEKNRTDENAVTVFELARRAQKEVLDIRQKLWGEPVGTVNRLTANDFPIGYRVAIGLSDLDQGPATPSARYVVTKEEQVRSKPDSSAPVNRTARSGTEVYVLEFTPNNWADIAKDGAEWGFIPAEELLLLQ